jgi:hypothetical protein
MSLTTVAPVYKPAYHTEKRFRVLYGGSGSAKSVFAHQDEVGRLRDQKQRLIFIRKTKDTHRRSCFQLCRDIISDMNWSASMKINKSDMTIESGSGSIAWFVGMDDPEKLKSITGPTRILIEEGTELNEEDIFEIDRRLRGPGTEQITILFNPVPAARRIFQYIGINDKALPSRTYIENEDAFVQHTTWRDNPFIDEDYVRVFQRQGGVNQQIYDEGILVAHDEPDQLIKWEWVKASYDRDPDSCDDGSQRLGIDPAWQGDDNEVMQRFEGFALVETIETNFGDLNRLADHAGTIIADRDIPVEKVGIDAVGIGAGAYDNLVRNGYEVNKIISGASPIDDVPHIPEEIEFTNLRSQMWYFAREMFERGLVSIAIPDGPERQKLQEDLLAPRFRSLNGVKFEVEPKRGTKSWGIKSRLGRSPDHGDAFVYGLFAEHACDTASIMFAV